jgi:hypothetical protein
MFNRAYPSVVWQHGTSPDRHRYQKQYPTENPRYSPVDAGW